MFKSGHYFYGLVFVFGLLLNILWENLHSILYVHYQGEIISEAILLKASFFDALIICLLWGLAHKISARYQVEIFVAGSLLFAVILEIWALGTNRWAYNELMPLVPILKVGWSPTVQLAVTGTLSFGVTRATIKLYVNKFK